ncbi:MAG: DoxX family membrane protein [Desulfobacterales bacterium]|nr:DoxX family membrane protein [Desulfobacterales bacterium]
MKSKIKVLFEKSWIELIFRWLIGMIFVYASFHKIASPAMFAKIIYGYYLFPDFSINLIAIILPFLELYCGLFLLLGIYPRSASIVTTGMLFGFIVAISINLIRGHEFDCGCFSFGGTGHKTATLQLFIRDIFYFICSLYIILFKGHRKLCVYTCETL